MAAKRGPKSRAGKGRSPDTGINIPASLSSEETSEFNRLVDAIRSVGTLSRTDPALIEAAARTKVLIDRAYQELAGSEFTLTTANGTVMPHPMLGVIANHTMRLRGLLNDLGLTAKSAKLGGNEEAKRDSRWEGILNVAG